jgi:hypothetical protein
VFLDRELFADSMLFSPASLAAVGAGDSLVASQHVTQPRGMPASTQDLDKDAAVVRTGGGRHGNAYPSVLLNGLYLALPVKARKTGNSIRVQGQSVLSELSEVRA